MKNKIIFLVCAVFLTVACEKEQHTGKESRVSVTVYDENGKAVYLATKIATPKAETAVSDKPNCDVNGDGKVDLLDITYCQKYYRQGSDSPDWSDFKQCDLDGDGLIGIQDLIIILQAM